MSLINIFSKLIMGLIFLLFCLNAPAENENNGLPFESDLTKLKLAKISIGRQIKLNFHLSIPETQKINQGASSHVSVFEKEKGAKVWVETKKISLNGFAELFNMINLEKNIELRSSDSEIAVHATIYHCGKKDTKIPCFIQGFQGFARRDPKLKNKTTIPFTAKAFVY